MDRFLNFNLPTLRCKGPKVLLACAWFLGLVTGILFSISASDSLFPTMRAAVSGCVSISGLLSAMLLPLLFSAFAVYISQPLLLIPIAFLKALIFSFLGMSIMAAYGSAGWLVRFLLMFSDCMMLPFLWWYWLQAISCPRRAAVRNTALVFVIAVMIGSFDYCVISPFLAKVISI